MSQYSLIGNQLEVILKDKMGELPIKEVGDIFIDKVEIDTQRGVDPAGQTYTPYAPSTAKRKGRSSPVTMRDKSRSVETLDQQARNMETRLGFQGSAGYGNSSKPSSEVFYMHQEGTARGGKKRKVFPEQEDLTSPGVQSAIERVEVLLEEYFNE